MKTTVSERYQRALMGFDTVGCEIVSQSEKDAENNLELGEPAEFSELEKFAQSHSADIPKTESQISEALVAGDQWRKERLQLEERQTPRWRRLAGIINEEEMHDELRLILEKQKAGPKSGKQPIFESTDDGPTKRRKLWESQQRGEITLTDCLNQTAQIRVEEEHAANPRRRMLTESQHHSDDDCGCLDCNLTDFKIKLDERVQLGQMSRAQATRCYNIRLGLG